MKYERKKLEILANSGYLKEETRITAEEYEKLSDLEKEGYIERAYTAAGGGGVEYVKVENVTEDFNEGKFSNVMLLEMYEKITKCERSIKIITIIMIVFAVIASIGIIGSFSAISSINEIIKSLLGGLRKLY